MIPKTIYERFSLWSVHRDNFLACMELGAGSHKEDDVLMRLVSGEYQIWGDADGAAVTSVLNYPQIKAINILYTAGGLEALNHRIVPFLEGYAKASGVTRIYCGGRKGWQRVMPGSESLGELLYKDI